MMKKIHWVMLNIVTFVLILLLIVLPILHVKTTNGNLVDKTLFGWNFLGGYSITISSELKDDAFSQVIVSKLLGFIPILMLLSMFFINRMKKVTIGKDLINFLCLGVTFVYMFLLPVTAYSFVNENYINELEFTAVWGYYVLVSLIGACFIYYIAMMIKNIVNSIKEAKKAEQEKQNINNNQTTTE